MNQSEFVAIPCNLLKAREKPRVKVAIGFGFPFHWLINWREIFKPITKRSNCNRQSFENCSNNFVSNINSSNFYNLKPCLQGTKNCLFFNCRKFLYLTILHASCDLERTLGRLKTSCRISDKYKDSHDNVVNTSLKDQLS